MKRLLLLIALACTATASASVSSASGASKSVAPFTVDVGFSKYQRLGSDGYLVKTIRARGRDVKPGSVRVSCSRKFCGSLYRRSKPRRSGGARRVTFSNVRWVVSKRRYFRVKVLPRTSSRVGLFADVFSPDEYNSRFSIGRVGCVRKSGRVARCPAGARLPIITRKSAQPQSPVYPGGDELAVAPRGLGKLTLFTRGRDGACWWRDYDVASGWTGWNSLGGSIQGAPSAVFRAGGIDLFATSDSGGAAGSLMTLRRNMDGSWGAWRDLGGQIVGGPAAVSRNSDRIDLFARSTSDGLLHRTSTDGVNWNSWAAVGATKTYASPSAVKASSGNIHVVYRSPTGSVWRRIREADGAWQPSDELGGTTDQVPAITQTRSGHLSLFILDTNRRISWRDYNSTVWGAWAPFSSTGAAFQGSPVAGSWGEEHMVVLARDLQSTLHQRVHAAGSWSTWHAVGN